MTTEAQFCWIEVNGAVPGPPGPSGPPGPAGVGRDTLFGHGTTFGTNPTPVDGEAQYDLASGRTQSFEGGSWVDHTTQEGDEYVDLDTGITYSLVGVTGVAHAQRTFVVSEADFLAGINPVQAQPGDVVLSSTGGYAKIV